MLTPSMPNVRGPRHRALAVTPPPYPPYSAAQTIWISSGLLSGSPAMNVGAKRRMNDLKQQAHCRLSTILLVVCRPYGGPSSTVNTSFSLKHDLEHRLRLDLPPQEATVKIVTWLHRSDADPAAVHEAYLAYRGIGRAGTKPPSTA